MAMWRPLNYKSKKVVRQYGDGVNTFAPPMSINESELTDVLNMCADDYPDIRTRNDRVVESTGYASSTALNAFGQRNNESIHILDGAVWKYRLPASTAWTTISSTLLNQTGKFVEFNTQAYRFTVLANGSSAGQKTFAFDGSTTLVDMTTNAPHSNLYTAHRYRVFGVESDKRNVKHSAQGSVADWITSLDAGNFDVTNARGPITAIRTYNDHVIIWAENSYHEVYGTDPLNYNLVDGSYEIGCVNDKAHVENKGKLYWMHYGGIYLYTGSTPRIISQKVDKWIKGINWSYKNLICAGNKGDKVYFAIPYKSTVINIILVYDTFKDKWFVEDGNFVNFTNIADTLYGLNADGRIWNMNSTLMTGADNSTAIAWSMETKAYNNNELSYETGVKDVWMLHSGSTSATMNIDYSTDVYSTSYNSLAVSSDMTYTNEPSNERTIVPLDKLQQLRSYRLKYSGTGFKRIHGTEVNTLSHGG